MIRLFLTCGACVLVLLGCGGGAGSTQTTITGPGLNASRSSPPVALPFVQAANNLPVTVDAGPAASFSLTPNANVLYATVTVCAPGDAAHCQTIDHVQVDTGSVGLRVLASKLQSLNLPSISLGTGSAWECYPFVIGGLWGSTAVADVRLGPQWARALPVQLIQDDAQAAMQAPMDCVNASNGQVLGSASTLGANGILGIGSVTLDCGLLCVKGSYAGSYVQYYSCPKTAQNSTACSAAAVPAAMQVFNPVAALPLDNNGVVLSLPPVTGLGASTVSGELVLGINTQANNQLDATVSKVRLGVDWANAPDAYMNVTTRLKGQTIKNSYLDTGTNGLFFTDSPSTLARCQGSTWYCPAQATSLNAEIADGDALLPSHSVPVVFGVGNAEALFLTTNSAFGDLAGAPPSSSGAGKPAFAWGLPFFYGKKVYASIWQQAGAESGPWYAWKGL